MSSTSELREGVLVVDLEVGNGGDEPAFSVTPVLGFQGGTARGMTHRELAPAASVGTTLTLPGGDGVGRWPVSLTIDYADANGYLFQALQVFAVETGDPPPAPFSISELGASRLANRAELSFSIRNLTSEEHRVRIGVLVPRGLEITGAVPELVLRGREERTLSFPVINRSALPGSELPVFVTVQTADGVGDQTALGNGVIRVVGSSPALAPSTLLFGVGSALLALAAAVLWVKRRTLRRGSTQP